MAEDTVHRRLTVVVSADVVAYSRLIGADEAGTRAALNSHRRELIDPNLAEHHGRLVSTAGDSLLAEFTSVVAAVQWAVEFQRGMKDRNVETPVDRRIIFRIGINLGEVIVEGEDIHGDGVNVAARLQALAAPGGICISGKVFEEAHNRIDVGFEDLGEIEVKNIARPIRVFRAGPERVETADSGPPDAPALEVPDKPSIAVLPFDNLSGDPEQEHFADGMTEDLITDLSKVSGLFVVARHSSFAYKGKTIDVRAVAAQLGVRYVLEGSVRKSGNRVRINAQLIDATSGGHMWADRYDGSVENVFELQDEVGVRVVSALSVQLTRGETDSLKRVHTSNLDAYELFIRARTTPYPPVPERINSARKMFETVIKMDPGFAGGYAGVSAMLSLGAMLSHVDASEPIAQAIKMAQKAVSVDETFGWSYTSLGMALLHRKQYDDAIAAALEAITRQPSDADAHAFLGLIQGLGGQYAAGVGSIDQAIRFNPQYFNGPYLNQSLIIQVLAGDYVAAIETFRENIGRQGPVGPPALWAPLKILLFRASSI